MFHLVQLAIDETGLVIARKETQPLYQLREDAMVLAEFDAARRSDEYGYDADRNCWWARDGKQVILFVVEPVGQKIAA
jgi:hypothetical protein